MRISRETAMNLLADAVAIRDSERESARNLVKVALAITITNADYVEVTLYEVLQHEYPAMQDVGEGRAAANAYDAALALAVKDVRNGVGAMIEQLDHARVIVW